MHAEVQYIAMDVARSVVYLCLAVLLFVCHTDVLWQKNG